MSASRAWLGKARNCIALIDAHTRHAILTTTPDSAVYSGSRDLPIPPGVGYLPESTRGAGSWRWRRALATTPASLRVGGVCARLHVHVADGAIGIVTPGPVPRR